MNPLNRNQQIHIKNQEIIKNMQQLFQMLTPSNFYFYPQLAWIYLQNTVEYEPVNAVQVQEGQSKKREQYVQENQKKTKMYYQIYQQQLTKFRELANKKHWSNEEDQLLLKMDPKTANWDEIARRIPDTNAAICKRRFIRLNEQLTKWPKEIDEMIIQQHQKQNLCWGEIRKNVNQIICKNLKLPKFTTNKIKERYMLYLRPGISREEWSMQEDLEIIKLIKESGKQWVKLIKNNTTLQSRTQLQIKNRYFGTLKFLQKKVLRKVASAAKQKNLV